jgi:hypothetical protein
MRSKAAPYEAVLTSRFGLFARRQTSSLSLFDRPSRPAAARSARSALVICLVVLSDVTARLILDCISVATRFKNASSDSSGRGRGFSNSSSRYDQVMVHSLTGTVGACCQPPQPPFSIGRSRRAVTRTVPGVSGKF